MKENQPKKKPKKNKTAKIDHIRPKIEKPKKKQETKNPKKKI